MEQVRESQSKRFLKRLVYGLGSCFPISPSNDREAIAVCQALRAQGIPTTLGKLSKAGDDPVSIVAEYRTASDELSSSDDFYISLKPPALAFNPQHVDAVVAKALQNGQGVHFDAHGFAFADETFKLLAETMRRTAARPNAAWTFGVTLPSRWKRSAADARWVAQNGVRPRLVKGDFPGSSAEEVDPVQGYLELVDLLAGEVPELAVATHDCILAQEVVSRCRNKGAAVELELFFGMPSSGMMALSRELQVPLRFYVPYGDTLIVYLIKDLLTNPHKALRPNALEVLASRDRKLARITGSSRQSRRSGPRSG